MSAKLNSAGTASRPKPTAKQFYSCSRGHEGNKNELRDRTNDECWDWGCCLLDTLSKSKPPSLTFQWNDYHVPLSRVVPFQAE
jgi:hypothetical protein